MQKIKKMKQVLLFALALLPVLGMSQAIEATLINRWHDESIVPAFFDNPYHDVWGTVINDREIGIISSTDGFHFFDLSEENGSGDMEPVAFVQGADTGGFIAHRDFKTYQNYLYGVADEGNSALQVIDMSGLPETAVEVYQSNEFVITCHNIFIDEDNARLYMVGGNGFSVRILSLENPEEPTLLASFPNADFQIPYVHDLYVRDNIGYLNVANVGFWVVDFNDPDNAFFLGTMESYPQQGYNHSGWLSDDGNTYFLCDETHGLDVKVVDVSDFTDMEVIATMNAGSTFNQIPHNVYILGDLLYISYYYDGLQVFDVSNPAFPRKVAYYDTSDEINTSYFAGAWGVFVLPSGRPLISDMNNGFYVFEPIEPAPNTFLTSNLGGVELCPDIPFTFSVLVGEDFSPNGVTLTTENSSPELNITLSTTNAQPGEVIDVEAYSTASGVFDLIITGTDGTNESDALVVVNSDVFPDQVGLLFPPDEDDDASINPFFLWNGGSGNQGKRLEISTSETEFEANIFFTQQVNGNSYSLPSSEALEEGETYFWRVVATYDCGDNPSVINSFTTEVSTGLSSIAGQSFTLAPNPASDQVHLLFDWPLQAPLQVELINLGGQVIQQLEAEVGENSVSIAVGNLPNGIYGVKIANNNTATIQKVVVKR